MYLITIYYDKIYIFFWKACFIQSREKENLRKNNTLLFLKAMKNMRELTDMYFFKVVIFFISNTNIGLIARKRINFFFVVCELYLHNVSLSHIYFDTTKEINSIKRVRYYYGWYVVKWYIHIYIHTILTFDLQTKRECPWLTLKFK